jgi:hypothetical protein
MKLPVIFFFCTLLTVIVSAQTKKEQSDVEAAVESLRKAMIDADKVKLESIAASEVSYGHSSGMVENKTEFVENIVSGKSDFVAITLADQTVSIVGNVALVRHKLMGDTNNNGTPGKINLHVLLVWQKQGQEWKLIARQATRLPQ